MALGPGFMQTLLSPVTPVGAAGMPGTPVADVYNQVQRQKLAEQEMAQRAQLAEANNAISRGYLGLQQKQFEHSVNKFRAQQEDQRLKQHEAAIESLRAARATDNPELEQAAVERIQRMGLQVDQVPQPVGTGQDFRTYEGPTYMDPETLQVMPQNPEELWADVNDPSVLDDETEYEIRRVPQEGGAEKIQVRPKLARDPTAPKGMVVRDPVTGNVLSSVAPNRLEQRQTRIGSAAGLLPEAKRVMDAAMAAGMSDAEALEVGIKANEKILDRQSREKRTAIGSGQALGGSGLGGGATLGSTKEITNIDTNFLRTMQKLGTDARQTYGAADAINWMQRGSALLAKFNSPDAQSQNEGVNELIKLAQGSRPSDADRKFALRSTGALNDLGREILQWAPGRKGGTLPRDQLAQLKRYALLMMKAQQEILEKVRNQVRIQQQYNGVLNKMSPEDRDMWIEYIVHTAAGGDPSQLPARYRQPDAQQGGNAPPASAAKKSPDADERALDIMGGD